MNDLLAIWIPNILGTTISPLELAWLLMALTTTVYTRRIHLRAQRAHSRVVHKMPSDAILHEAADHALSCVHSGFLTQGFALTLGFVAAVAPNPNDRISVGAIIPIVCIMGMEAVQMYESIRHLHYIERMERQ